MRIELLAIIFFSAAPAEIPPSRAGTDVSSSEKTVATDAQAGAIGKSILGYTGAEKSTDPRFECLGFICKGNQRQLGPFVVIDVDPSFRSGQLDTIRFEVAAPLVEVQQWLNSVQGLPTQHYFTGASEWKLEGGRSISLTDAWPQRVFVKVVFRSDDGIKACAGDDGFALSVGLMHKASVALPKSDADDEHC